MDWVLAGLVPVAAVASWYDWRQHRVPNWLTAGVAVSGLTCQALFGGPPALLAGVTGMLAGLGLLVVLWLIGAMGAGDVKLASALGAWLGPQMIFHAVLAGGLLGGVLAVAVIARRRAWRPALSGMVGAVNELGFRRDPGAPRADASSRASAGVVPYAIPLCLGALIVVVCNYSGWWEVL